MRNEPVDRSTWTSPLATTDQLRIQRLISDLAGRFVAVEPDAIDDLVVDSLRQIGEALQLDRAIVWSPVAGGANLVPFQYWIKPAESSAPHALDLTSIPFIASNLEARDATWFTRLEDVPDGVDREALRRHELHSAVVVPVACPGVDEGAHRILAFGSATERKWTPAIIEELRLVSEIVAQALARKASLKALQLALDELRQLRERMTVQEVQERLHLRVLPTARVRDQLHAENAYLRSEVQQRLGTEIIVGHSPAIHRVLEQVRQVAATDSTVLLLGETGTGKELIATHLHDLSARCKQVMVRVNCSAIPATLMESELFGRERGAFTGALARQIGRFELADRSTIFLDEIGDLPADVQVKLLRVLEERQVERLGSPKAIPVNVRIVAATHRNLEQRIAENTFREDLFYRLNVFPIQVPALRDRSEDIPLLVWRFVVEFAKTFGKRIESIPRENMDALQRYPWPGNIRELRNAVERAMIVSTGTELTVALPEPSRAGKKHSVIMADVEREHMRSVLESTRWRIRGAGGAAERLGLRPTTLETRMVKLGLARPRTGVESIAH
jgi:formate hydrogenlyase transcriptional activator